jgi:hypothetical protein
LADDTATKDEILFTAGSYVEPAAKTFITIDYSARRDPTGHKPAVIRISTGYLKTVGKGLGGELTFYSSVEQPSLLYLTVSFQGVQKSTIFALGLDIVKVGVVTDIGSVFNKVPQLS